MRSDLHDPLGLDGPAAQPQRRTDIPWGAIALAGLGAMTLGLIAFSVVTDNGMGGRPYAEAAIDRQRVEQLPVLPPPLPTASAALAASPEEAATAAELPTRQIASRPEIGAPARPQRGGGAAGPLIIQVPRESSVVARDAPLSVQLSPAPDPRLIEKGPHGLLPRIGADGAKPLDVYARPVVSQSGKAGQPRITIIVGGMGLNVIATRQAVEQLPDEVTLGFAPYGNDLTAQVASARAGGHEVLLHLPMEPHEKEDMPGQYALASGVDAATNLNNLHWLLSRAVGYIGVVNFMGNKFTAREGDLVPILREISARGLAYLDDATSAQSIAVARAQAVGAAAARADIVLDAVTTPDGVEAALGRLEALARQKGSAIGFAQGLPFAIEPIARFARGLDKRGLSLVPFSAAVARANVTATAGVPQ